MRYKLMFLAPLLFACSLLAAPAAPTSAPSASQLPPAAPSPTSTLEPTAVPISFPDPSAYTWSPVAGELESPVDLQNAGDARLFILEQAGVIRRLDGAGLPVETFLDIRDRVGSSGNEQGLLGLALHPAFASNGFFYVNYTDRNGDTVISRFSLGSDPGRADPDSELVILQIDQPYANHNGGGTAFGPDGMLYIGTGDGGSQGDPEGRAQNLDSLLGKILRLDVDGGDPYAIPPDNPFASGGGRPEIWAYGFRNPWRFAFDPETADLFIGDVGQNQWEEVDHVSAGTAPGTNFGWDFREGLAPYEGSAPTDLTDPVAVYSHEVGGCSVTGGVVVRDPVLAEWNGVYLYGDYCSGLIWGLFQDDSGIWQNQLLFSTGFQITSFGTGSDGAVYVLDRGGQAYRLTRGG